jgi:vacuolar-type H+-ATPase subunit F/Vma7
MTHSVRVVCRPAVRDGFALAGVRSVPAVDASEAAAVLAGLVEQSDTGVVLVEESLYRALPEELRDSLEHRTVPVVVPFPGPRAAGERPSAEADLVELLRSAIGYRVRLR